MPISCTAPLRDRRFVMERALQVLVDDHDNNHWMHIPVG